MSRQLVKESAHAARDAVNSWFRNRDPFQIVLITSVSLLTTLQLWHLLTQDESLISKLKRRAFKWLRLVPSVRAQIDTELNKLKDDFESSIRSEGEKVGYTLHLPNDGLSDDAVLQRVDAHVKLGHYSWKKGKVSGAVYTHNEDLYKLVTAVYGKSAYTNPLHPDVFPGICKMEAEVIRMVATLFHGGPDACGCMTTGGTESIMMAVKAYRDYAREHRGIDRPNIVMPVTAHCGFNKAAHYLGLHIRTVRVDSDTYKVDIAAMRRAINRNTVMLVGSAPNFPYGTMDDIEAIAALGRRYNIPVHVDACLGGFLAIFMPRAGYPLPPFDFAVPGVTSISADTHKYGFTPKGSSVVLYSHPKYRSEQFTVTTDWPGGVYGSPTVSGSRAGGIIAATWATLMHFGLDGYTEATKRIIDTSRYIESKLRQMKGLFIFGTPATSVVAFGSKDFDVYRLSGMLSERGWHLNSLQFPPGVHICVTDIFTKPGIADEFIKDFKECHAEIMKDPGKPAEGRMAIYGVAQALPDRSLVVDFTRCFLNAMYYTPVEGRRTD